MKKLFFTFGVVALLLAGCETTSSQPYKASTDNIISLKQSFANTGKSVQLAAFSVKEGVKTELTCRAMGAIEVAPGKDAVTFIHDAFKEELFAAGAYDPTSSRTLKAEITEFAANSWGTGKWDISLKVSSDAYPQGYEVTTNYTFKTSFSAISACQNVVDAFTPSVQDLIKKVIAHPNFTNVAK